MRAVVLEERAAHGVIRRVGVSKRRTSLTRKDRLVTVPRQDFGVSSPFGGESGAGVSAEAPAEDGFGLAVASPRRLRRTQRRAAARSGRLLAARRSAASRGGRRARHHRIQPPAAPARRQRHRRFVWRRGGDRDGQAAAPAAGLLGLRPGRRHAPRPAGQALAAPQPRRLALRGRVRAAAGVVPRLRAAPGSRAVGAARLRLHARLRGPGRVPRPADGQDPDRQAAADRVGLGRADRRACRRRPP